MPTDLASALRRADDLLRQGHSDAALAEYVRLAEHYRQEGFLPKASALYKKVLKIKPNDETALLRSGEIAEAQGLVADAKTAFLSLSEKRRRRGDRTGAAQLLVRAGSLDPSDVPGQRRAVAALLDLGDRAGAAGIYKDLAFHLLKRGRRNEAIDLLREAGEQESLGPDAAGPLLEKHRRHAAGTGAARPTIAELKTVATLLVSLGLDDQALKALADADPAAPVKPVVTTPAVAHARAGSAASRPADAAPAAPPLRVVPRQESTPPVSDEIIDVLPLEPSALDPPARDLTDTLDVEEAPELPPDAETTSERATLLTDLSDLFDELKQEATDTESAEMRARELELGERYYHAGKIGHAERALRMATRSPDQRFRAAALLGRIELERGRAWDAIRWFERATDAQPPSRDVAHELLYELANTLETVGERERALAVFIELRMDEPHYRDVARRVGRLMKKG